MPPLLNPLDAPTQCRGQKTLCQSMEGQALIMAASLADSETFDVYLVQVSNFSIPSSAQYPLSPIQKPEYPQL